MKVKKKDERLYAYGDIILYALYELLIIMILARTYPQERFSEWVLFYTSLFLLDRIRHGAVFVPLIKKLAEKKGDFPKQITGASWRIALIFTAILSTICLLISLFEINIQNQGFGLFLKHYPLYGFVSLPYHFAIARLQAKLRFKRVFLLRLINASTFILFILLNGLLLRRDIGEIIQGFILFNGINSVIALKWSGITWVTKGTWEKGKELILFGKYTMGTSVGAYLLKSSDTLLIGFLMTSTDLALYTIPLRLIEGLEIPLIGCGSFLMPILSEKKSLNKEKEVRELFYSYTRFFSLLFIPLLGLLFLFSKELIFFLGGKGYAQAQSSVIIFRIFLIYGLFLTFDRFTGITLQSIGKPEKNFVKVLLMVIINAIGDLGAIHFFNSITAVSVITIITVVCGVVIGYLILKKEINISLRELWKYPGKIIPGLKKT